MRYAHFMPLSALLLSLVVTACANTPLESVPAKDNAVMTNSEPEPAISPRLTAEQALNRLLELIRSSKYVSEFTFERLSQIMGVEIIAISPGYYGFGEQVSKDWWYGFEMRENPKTGVPFSFSFNKAPGTSPDMTDICQLDFDKFSAELVAMGFSKTPYYVEHGRLMNYTFDRIQNGILEMRIDVYPRGEANDPPEKVRHDCVEMIQIF